MLGRVCSVDYLFYSLGNHEYLQGFQIGGIRACPRLSLLASGKKYDVFVQYINDQLPVRRRTEGAVEVKKKS